MAVAALLSISREFQVHGLETRGCICSVNLIMLHTLQISLLDCMVYCYCCACVYPEHHFTCRISGEPDISAPTFLLLVTVSCLLLLKAFFWSHTYWKWPIEIACYDNPIWFCLGKRKRVSEASSLLVDLKQPINWLLWNLIYMICIL